MAFCHITTLRDCCRSAVDDRGLNGADLSKDLCFEVRHALMMLLTMTDEHERRMRLFTCTFKNNGRFFTVEESSPSACASTSKPLRFVRGILVRLGGLERRSTRGEKGFTYVNFADPYLAYLAYLALLDRVKQLAVIKAQLSPIRKRAVGSLIQITVKRLTGD